jgi:hypothetical protein
MDIRRFYVVSHRSNSKWLKINKRKEERKGGRE